MRYICLLLIIISILSLALNKNTSAQDVKEKVYVIPIKGMIDLGLAGFIKRAVIEAKTNNAKAIIFEIDTFGGRVDAAIDICSYIKDASPIPTYAYITNQAWSAGALISLSCKEIYMLPGASIGSAEPRGCTPLGKQELTDEKTISAIRAKFKALAEENNHPANLAAAMVDKDIELKLVQIKDTPYILTNEELEEKKAEFKEKDIVIVKTINPKGKLLNLTAKEAKEYKLAKKIINARDDLLKYLQLSGAYVNENSPNWAEVLVRFLTHPIASSLLLMLGIMGIYFEISLPGWSGSAIFGIVCLALFFWGHYLVGLANWMEIIMFASGIILVALEIFVIPGFGLAGITGITCIILSLFFALIKHPLRYPSWEATQALYIIAYAFIGAFLIFIISLKFLPKSRLWQKFILTASETKETGFKANELSKEKYLGKIGRTLTPLRPSGKAMFGRDILDVVTDGEFIKKNTKVKVCGISGSRIIVERKS